MVSKHRKMQKIMADSDFLQSSHPDTEGSYHGDKSKGNLIFRRPTSL
jgi:hypothetical protein